MNRGFFGLLCFVGVMSSFAVACGGESTEFSDKGDETGGKGGGSGTGGSSSKGGSSGTTGKGGTGGTGGTTEPPDGVCEDITACGGDPEGTWNVTESCFEAVIPFFDEPGCENSPGRASIDVSGTFTFEGGTMTTDLMTSAHVTIVIDDLCAQTQSGLEGITAADLCPVINAQFAMTAMLDGSCTAVPEGCRCDGAQPEMPSQGTDTYDIVGNQIILSDGSAMDYCREGEQLHLHSDAVDITESAVAGLTVLLDRQ
jgi:hypothetical protein